MNGTTVYEWKIGDGSNKYVVQRLASGRVQVWLVGVAALNNYECMMLGTIDDAREFYRRNKPRTQQDLKRMTAG